MTLVFIFPVCGGLGPYFYALDDKEKIIVITLADTLNPIWE